MTDLTDLAQAIYNDTTRIVKDSPAGYDTIARNAATTTLRTLSDHLGADGTLNGGDLQDLIDTLKDTR